MQYKFLKLWSLLTIVLCVLISANLMSCSDDDQSNGIVGEWISEDGDIYYQFLPNGTGRYICLSDEPGYSESNPDPVINNPEDPYYFDYTINGNTLTMKEYSSAGNKDDFTIYECEIRLSNNSLQIQTLRWSEDGENWREEVNPKWETYVKR